jgi:hypothetical protein
VERCDCRLCQWNRSHPELNFLRHLIPHSTKKRCEIKNWFITICLQDKYEMEPILWISILSLHVRHFLLLLILKRKYILIIMEFNLCSSFDVETKEENSRFLGSVFHDVWRETHPPHCRNGIFLLHTVIIIISWSILFRSLLAYINGSLNIARRKQQLSFGLLAFSCRDYWVNWITSVLCKHKVMSITCVRTDTHHSVQSNYKRQLQY